MLVSARNLSTFLLAPSIWFSLSSSFVLRADLQLSLWNSRWIWYQIRRIAHTNPPRRKCGTLDDHKISFDSFCRVLPVAEKLAAAEYYVDL